MTIPTVEFSAVLFCESLFIEACTIAKAKRGQEILPNQLQMLDLVTAFRNMRQMDYTNQFGLIAGEWNEAIAIIKTYISAANHKATRILHPELGLVIGSVIVEWGRFEEIPKELQKQVHTAKQGFQNTEDTFMNRLNHFFNEMKIRASSLESPEKEGVISLISLYQPQARNACHKGEIESVLIFLGHLEMDLNRL
jgi:hypothetical protein